MNMIDQTKAAIDYAKEQVELAAKNKDRSVTVYVGEAGMQVSVYPYPEMEIEDA